MLSEARPREPARDLWPEVASRLSERRARRTVRTAFVPSRPAWAIAGLVAVLLIILLVGVLSPPHVSPPLPLEQLAVQSDLDAPTYARWHIEASMNSALADRYALAFVVSSEAPPTGEAGTP